MRHFVDGLFCYSCCVHTLLDDFEEMNAKIGIANSEFERVSASQFANIPLKRVNETINNLTATISFLQTNGALQTLIGFDPSLNGLERAADRRSKQSIELQKTAQNQLDLTDKAREELLHMRSIGAGKRNAIAIVDSIEALENYLRAGAGSKTAGSIAQAEPLLMNLKRRNMDNYRSNAMFELGPVSFRLCRIDVLVTFTTLSVSLFISR